jgi:glyoxylase-like metal-dependent hydrolase (beta-lactamase superfamily II)
MKQWQVGDVTITKVLEMEMPVPFPGLLPAATPAHVDRHPWLCPHFVTDAGEALVSFHGLVIDTGSRRILVDTCIGNDRVTLPQIPVLHGPFLDNLAEAGYKRDDIDTVICTHLHFDHVGWNTMLVNGKWVPTFPGARYLLGRIEWAHWQTGAKGPVSLGDTVQPVIDAGLVDLVEVDHRVSDEVQLEPTPGHTPGHVSVVITSRGESAVITGDLAHHPLQWAEPQLGSSADGDPILAEQSRRAFAARYADGDTLVIGTHFGGPTAGHLVGSGVGSWRLAIA